MQWLHCIRHDAICLESCRDRSEGSLGTFVGLQVSIELLCEVPEPIDHLAVFAGDVALLADVRLEIKEGNLRLLLALKAKMVYWHI